MINQINQAFTQSMQNSNTPMMITNTSYLIGGNTHE